MTATIRMSTVWLTAAGLLVVSGCIPSQPLAEREMDRYWLLTDVAAKPVGAAGTPADETPAGGFRMPTRWVIRQHGSTIWTTVSIVHAMDKLKAGTDKIEFSVSPAHARALTDVLAEARAALADLEDMIDSGARSDQNRWADALAAALVKIESVARHVTIESGAPPAGADEPFGMAGEPLLQMISMYLDERADGGLLADLSPGELRRLRDVLVQVVVKLGFEIAGKEPDAAVRHEAAELMRRTDDVPALEKALAKLLTERIAGAPAARGPSTKRKTVKTVLSWAPRALKMLESFLSQWDRMESITVEIVQAAGRRGVAVTIAVQPGREVRLANVMILVPTIVFRGATRIVVLPDATGADEAVVAFEPVGEGAVELRFEGIVYGLVKLLALPLADGPVREVRVSTSSRAGGERFLNVAMLTEAVGDRSDPRRMIVVQDSRVSRIVREAFALKTVKGKSETVVSYLTPNRRYTYQRVKGAPGE